MKPKIGIIPAVDNDRTAFVHRHYISAIEQAGGAPLIVSYTSEAESLELYLEICDGFLLIGGADIDPARYGSERLPQCGELVPERDAYEFAIFKRIFDTGKPIFAICRGMQLVNTALGGTLYQDIPTEHPSEIVHRDREIKYTNTHRIRCAEGSPISRVCDAVTLTVNSYHHQSIKTLGEGLCVMAEAIDGIIEAIYHRQYGYLLGVQWHPERMGDAASGRLFEDFVHACKRKDR